MTDKNDCMRKMYAKIKDSVEDRLRGLCGSLSPEKRMTAIIVMAGLFALVNFYMIFRAIYGIGQEDVRQETIRIAPLDIPEMIPADTLSDEKVREMEEFFNRFNEQDNE
ncbi:TraL conjugative transposon family protein [Bacteroides gallinarum]|uniref:TraL conjugative transposon family protein n=2 Tax=Bacteroides gallinarum TaxID=376806 RepID=UPI00036E38FB|nr:TraL conjugative transposon family protein [Bacteroides gallinarum]